LRIENISKILDLFFIEGWKSVIKLSLAILSLAERDLLEMGREEDQL